MKIAVDDIRIERILDNWERKSETDEDLAFEGTIEC